MKKIIRNILNNFNYDIVKINYNIDKLKNKIVKVKVRNFELEIPGNNPLAKHYSYFPDYNIELGNLSKIIFTKYLNAVMIDVGANVGDTIAVVKSISAIPIIAIEGDKFVFSFLKKNIINFENTFTINQFLGSEDKSELVDFKNDGWNTTLIPSEKGTSVNIKKLDTTLKQSDYNNKFIKLLKIDAEGYDTIIIRGALETICNFKPVLFFEYNRENMDAINESENALSTLFALIEYGYETILYLDNHGRLLLQTSLNEKNTLIDLHNYADGQKGLIPHYDICIFHKEDTDLLTNFLTVLKTK